MLVALLVLDVELVDRLRRARLDSDQGGESWSRRMVMGPFSFSIWLAASRTRRAISSMRRISPTKER